METTPIRMSPTGFKAFVEVLSHPLDQHLKWSSSFNAPLPESRGRQKLKNKP